MLSAKETLVITAITFVVGMLLMVASVWKDKRVEEMYKACTAKSGVLLEHTYKVGKFDQYNYVCVDPKAIIEY